DETIAGRTAATANPGTAAVLMDPAVRARSGAEVLELSVRGNGGELRAFVTRDYNQPTARGVGRGADAGAVKRAYGEPARVHRTPASEWYVYERTGLIVRFGANSTVEGWSIYSWRGQ